VVEKVSQFLLVALIFGASADPLMAEGTEGQVGQQEIMVLLAEDTDSSRSTQLVENVKAGRHSRQLVSVLAQNAPRAARFLMGRAPGFSGASGQRESARSKLGRYIILEFPASVDVRAVLDDLRSDELVEYALLNDTMKVHTSCDIEDFPATPITTSRDYARNAINAPAAWAFQQGHTYVAVLESGIDPNHPDHVQFSGSNYSGGNFLEHISLDIGNQVIATGVNANPYTGKAIKGEVDEYLYKEKTSYPGFPAVSDCDNTPTGTDFVPGNQNGYVEAFIAGHGTHVAGILAANGSNASGEKGACLHCPLSVVRWTASDTECVLEDDPVFFDRLEHPDGSISESNLEFKQAHVTAAIAFSVDIGAQVINFSGGARDGFRCSSAPNDPRCLALEYAQDRDVIVVASAGNSRNTSFIDFPASDPRVIGVSGLDVSGNLWVESSSCGSSVPRRKSCKI